MLPKDQASGIVKGVAVCFAVLALGTVLFYAWGFYLYESDKAQAVAQAHTVPIEYQTSDRIVSIDGEATVPYHQYQSHGDLSLPPVKFQRVYPIQFAEYEANRRLPVGTQVKVLSQTQGYSLVELAKGSTVFIFGGTTLAPRIVWVHSFAVNKGELK
jgi:hypothetical protein